jgi:hypothetical protein
VFRRVALAALLAASGVAHADDSADDQQVVVVNTAPRLGDTGQIQRLTRVLENRGLLVKLPDQLAATLDGRNLQLGDIDAIRDAYNSADYELALKLIDADQERVLGEAVSGDPIPALATLAEWHGVIASMLKKDDEALSWFRATRHLNPAWEIDTKVASPRVRAMVKKARHEPEETGIVKVAAEPEDAKVVVDGTETHAAGDKIELRAGIHLVMVSAQGRKPYAELVEVKPDEPYKIEIALDKESKLDRAARLVDESAAAPPGKARLKRAQALSKLTNHTKILFVEDGTEDHLTVRLYDVDAKKVSRPLELDGTASSAAIARKVQAALDPDNLIDANTIVVATQGHEESHWYSHWYVWAGAAVLVGGGIAGYESMTAEPTRVRGF